MTLPTPTDVEALLTDLELCGALISSGYRVMSAEPLPVVNEVDHVLVVEANNIVADAHGHWPSFFSGPCPVG